MDRKVSVVVLASLTFLWFGGERSSALEPLDARTIVLNTAGGEAELALRESLVKAFNKDYPHVTVRTSGQLEFAKLRAQVQTNNVEWDLTEVPDQDVTRVRELGLCQKLTKVDTREFPPYAAFPDLIGGVWYATVLAYRTDLYPKPPTKVSDFWDTGNFPGLRAVRDTPVDTFEIALLADGVPKDKLYPLDVDRAFRRLGQFKDNIGLWWTSGAQSVQAIATKQVAMSIMFNGRAQNLIKAGEPIGIIWDGAILKLSYFCIPKGAPNANHAEVLLSYWTKPEVQAEYAKVLPYAGPNKRLYEFLDADIAKNLPTRPEIQDLTVRADPVFWHHNLDKIRQRWLAWKLQR